MPADSQLSFNVLEGRFKQLQGKMDEWRSEVSFRVIGPVSSRTGHKKAA